MRSSVVVPGPVVGCGRGVDVAVAVAVAVAVEVAVAVAVVDGVAVGVAGEPVTVTTPRIVPGAPRRRTRSLPGWVNVKVASPFTAQAGPRTRPRPDRPRFGVPLTLWDSWSPLLRSQVTFSPVWIATAGLSQ